MGLCASSRLTMESLLSLITDGIRAVLIRQVFISPEGSSSIVRVSGTAAAGRVSDTVTFDLLT